ncbi:MAG TPA: hypothetical protein VKA19_10540 [Alphaproteobacteria bacterium]|nr:hypothetical protein [Alphaproteobacteria bacterium]
MWLYLTAVVLFCAGVAAAARDYPGGFDWPYMVASTLASPTDNPASGAWFAGAWTVSMVMLWWCVSLLKRHQPPWASLMARWTNSALQLGLVCFALVGLDMLLGRIVSKHIDKGHEIFALIAFFGTYLGVLGSLAQILRDRRFHALPVLVVATPLIGVGITQAWLYFKGSNLGWVDESWRAQGVPVWLSFAFWQWLAIGFLFAGIGLLVWANGSRRSARLE